MVSIIPPPGPATSDFSGCRTLVVQPDAPDLRQLSDMLRELRVARAEPCTSAEEAWRRLDEDAFNTLFLDWSVDLDAVAFLGDLRSLTNPHRMLPVVVTTGFTEPGYVKEIIAAGANEVLLRPYSLEAVAHRLVALIHEPRMFIRAESYFGPDRRRRRLQFEGDERRVHQNWCGMDRRRESLPPPGDERRQGQPGYEPVDRRTLPRGDRLN